MMRIRNSANLYLCLAFSLWAVFIVEVPPYEEDTREIAGGNNDGAHPMEEVSEGKLGEEQHWAANDSPASDASFHSVDQEVNCVMLTVDKHLVAADPDKNDMDLERR